jgi:hypothetical protein
MPSAEQWAHTHCVLPETSSMQYEYLCYVEIDQAKGAGSSNVKPGIRKLVKQEWKEGERWAWHGRRDGRKAGALGGVEVHRPHAELRATKAALARARSTLTRALIEAHAPEARGGGHVVPGDSRQPVAVHLGGGSKSQRQGRS